MPRVISGRLGGLRLQAPEGDQTRPTSDRVKEALFSALNSRMEFEGALILELFAGSGQLGIEALSRGALHCHFVERWKRAYQCLQQNLRHCHLEQEATLHFGDALQICRQLSESGLRFDLILSDPPYREAKTFLQAFDVQLGQYPLLKEGGLFLLEREAEKGAKAMSCTIDVSNLKEGRNSVYGTTMVSFYGLRE